MRVAVAFWKAGFGQLELGPVISFLRISSCRMTCGDYSEGVCSSCVLVCEVVSNLFRVPT